MPVNEEWFDLSKYEATIEVKEGKFFLVVRRKKVSPEKSRKTEDYRTSKSINY